MSGPCIVKNDFLNDVRNFNTEYALLPIEEKNNIKNTLLNKAVKTYKASQGAFINTKSNTKKAISNTCTITKDPQPAITGTQTKTLSNQNQSNSTLDNTIYTLTEALSNVDEAIIKSSVMKTFDLVERKNIISGFTDKELIEMS